MKSYLVKPRFEEQFNLINRFEKRVNWELENIANTDLIVFTELEEDSSQLDLKERF